LHCVNEIGLKDWVTTIDRQKSIGSLKGIFQKNPSASHAIKIK